MTKTVNKKRPKPKVEPKKDSQIGGIEGLGYEIVSFIHKTGLGICTKQTDGYFTCAMREDSSGNLSPRRGGSLQERLSSSTHEIYAVKRLYDEKVFKVGDKIVWDWASGPTFFTIKEIGINDNYIQMKFDTDVWYSPFSLDCGGFRLRHYEA